ncbi:MAG: CNNM domain-containing protein [Planctomycetota bacterium]|jgi:CBS domain containing-hemolysin-like protein|nr:CNNM domain-containing protein [Planctomycetota bacterium]
MTPLFCLIGLLGSLLLIFSASAMETAVYRVSRVRLRIQAEKGDARARAVLAVLDGVNAMVTAILINNNIASYAGAYLLTAQFADWRLPHPELIATVAITPVFFVLAESLPKQLAYSHAERLAIDMVGAFRLLVLLFLPMIKALTLLSTELRTLCGSPGRTDLSPTRRALLLEHLNAGVAENVLSEEQNGMAVRIMQLEGISAGDCMIPLAKLCLIPAGASRRAAIGALAGNRDSPALLVGADGRPTGLALTLEALVMLPGAPDEPAAPAAERLARLRASESAPEALRLFRANRTGQALVERNGRPVGLLTTRGVLDRVAGL